jgi:hypothetical protein
MYMINPHATIEAQFANGNACNSLLMTTTNSTLIKFFSAHNKEDVCRSLYNFNDYLHPNLLKA